MEADDKILSEDKGYQSCSSSCSSSTHSIEQIHNISNDSNKQSGILWPSQFHTRDREQHNSQKPSFQCPSPGCPVGDTVTHNETADIDELGDLLQRFDTFFRERVDVELQSVREFMHGMLTEQQIHLQQILSTRLQHSKSPFSRESSPLQSRRDDGFQDDKVPETPDEATMRLSMVPDTSETHKNSQTNEILLEMLSLSCELSAVLSQSKYL